MTARASPLMSDAEFNAAGTGDITSLVTRPGFSFKEPRRAASAGLVRKVKIYHISSELRDLDGFGGARWRNNSIPQ